MQCYTCKVKYVYVCIMIMKHLEQNSNKVFLL